MSHAAPSASVPLSCSEEACEAQGRLLAVMSEAREHQLNAHKEELARQERKRMDVKSRETSEILDLQLANKEKQIYPSAFCDGSRTSFCKQGHFRGERKIVWRVVSAAFRDGAAGPRVHSCRQSLFSSQICGLCPAVQAFCCVRAPRSHLFPVLGERAPPLTLPCRRRGQRKPRFDAAAAHITSLRHSRVRCCCSAGRSGCGTSISRISGQLLAAPCVGWQTRLQRGNTTVP